MLHTMMVSVLCVYIGSGSSLVADTEMHKKTPKYSVFKLLFGILYLCFIMRKIHDIKDWIFHSHIF